MVIVSDRDPRINNEFFRTLASYQGTSQRFTTAHRPQGNGQAEATNKEVVTKLRIYCTSYPYDWDLKVHHLAYAHNTTVHSVLAETPIFAWVSSKLCLHLILAVIRGSSLSRVVASEAASFRRDHALALKNACSRLVVDAATASHT